ncbi:MAG TPA: SPASM domain-containing protein, partial [Spirochaetia bacterium]|nr:SPASM domain-containing protein [Spirochaetia bacterium]
EFRPDGEPEPYAISGREWGEFLLGIFEKWSSGDSERVSVRHFDSILSLLVDDRVTSCILSRACNDYFVVEWNGDVYPCDFFVEPQKRLGNVLSESWSDFEGSEIRRRFAAAKSQWSSECARCPYLRFCAGDCQKMRYRTSENPRQLSWLCEGWKLFYEQTLPEFRKIARYVRSRRASVAAAPLPAGGSGPVPGGVPAAPRREPGRNDPCYCGSGKKYKHCHGR